MFAFVFSNLTGFFLAFIPALISCSLVAYISISLPRNQLVNVFALLTLCGGIWQIGEAISHISSNRYVADFWESFFSIGWIFIGPVCLHFSLLYSKLIQHHTPHWLLGLLYAPTFVLSRLYQSHVYKHEISYDSFWGWNTYHNTGLLDSGTVYWTSVCVIASCIILLRYSYSVRRSRLLFAQSILITTGVFIPTVGGILTEVVLPFFFEKPVIPTTPYLLTLLSLATVIALKRYRLFTLSDLINSEMLMHELPTMVLSISNTGHITYLNKFGMELLGIKKEHLVNSRYDEIMSHALPEHEMNFKRAYQEAIKGVHINNVESSLLVEERTINVMISACPIINNNKIRGVLLSIRDITELRTSIQLTQQKNRQLQQSNSNLEEFVFVASHDLKEPIRKIATFTEMLLNTEQTSLSEKGRSYFQRISAASHRMQTMIDDLLSLSVISQNNKFGNHNLQAVFTEATIDLDLQIKEKNAVINVERLPSVYINPEQFKQLFQNLISNSLKFSRQDVTPTINVRSCLLNAKETEELSLIKGNRYLKISLEDNGIGFENDYAEKIFQMFQRLHGRMDYEGTGIGLAVCKKVVENHKGIIKAYGVPNEGATFIVIIPVSPKSFMTPVFGRSEN